MPATTDGEDGDEAGSGEDAVLRREESIAFALASDDERLPFSAVLEHLSMLESK